MRTWIAILAVVLVLLLNACTDGPEDGPRLEHPDETGVLRVVTRNSATTYYLDRHERAVGPEVALVEAFADHRGWTVDWTVAATTAEVLDYLEAGAAHLAAAGLTHLDSRNQRFERGPAHTEITQQVVCHRDRTDKPRSPEDLEEVVLKVTAASSYVERLEVLAERYDALTFQEDQRGSEQLLMAVEEGRLACTVADSNIVRLNRRYLPHLDVTMDLTEGQNLGWYLAEGQERLAQQAFEWMNSRAGDEVIAAMENRYYTYVGEFDFVDLRALKRRMESRLPRYQRHFEQAEAETDMPADLLAALAYQESHWDPQARSPTGVRGMMMLTGRTAESLGVNDRLDPEQSIMGGARYLADRHERLPEHIPEPDRTFLALASYNVGRGHLLDARQLARDLGRDPDDWQEMREVLPLLSDERYYPNLRYGYARGYEPVHFVARIRNYRDVIRQAFE
ncbi:membrane-bound lytic murein transglycosylase MltF [Alkalilimnicola ehrlichii MLHE-1]|uniref:Membrane-bound lytic murein transglycosylase F 2 n=1 Tax=Alkalilimnicola ehrlichii (strain ATCC BAA-1101 / DSM 17681 / MLHE-1) TaxID=187272 RepID=MLTF2_ALKEH|nr:membrane-bound lytic murein transglycosylase MltF [Alkalilimnicola ehrlichii]Q0A9T8.1 RecName: Full=Membrane-bound lytic murein transglycosylase F 2; AltName: Full=Murein lyase F 2; Flags: Precursor [Alkalilimnicola ehrlichii MLHE-1]ABI56399.1 Lytic transglycosylase, catalytic [Alkalilimnicola ehrlichii MLHE-1]